MQVMEAQALHDCGMREHTCPLGQDGHEGVVNPHSTHRLKMVRKVRSTSLAEKAMFATPDFFVSFGRGNSKTTVDPAVAIGLQL